MDRKPYSIKTAERLGEILYNHVSRKLQGPNNFLRLSIVFELFEYDERNDFFK